MVDRGRPGPPARRRAIVAAAVVAAIVAVALAVLALTGALGAGPRVGVPREVSAAELRELAATAERPVYWAGAMPGRQIELTVTEEGNVFVRYIGDGAEAGDRRPAFTTVGTYPFEGAYREVERRGRAEGMQRRPAPGGGLATWSREIPTSVYVAYPGSEVLVEVYDPDPRRARELVVSGAVGPVR